MKNAQMGGVTVEGFRLLTTMVENHLAGKCEGFKTAVIAPKDINYGMSRMYQVLNEGKLETVMVFREPNEAIKWLRINDFSLE